MIHVPQSWAYVLMCNISLKQEIIDNNIIRKGKSHFSIKKSLISEEMHENIKNATLKCRENLTERIYWILNDIVNYPHCAQCGYQFKPRFYGLKIAYQNAIFCSNKCMSSNLEIIKTKKNTCENRYNDPNFRNPEKVRKTSLEKYGVEHFTQSPIVKLHVEEANLKAIGHKNYFQAETSKQKIRKTSLEKYGVEHYACLEECKQKMQTTSMSRYGVPFATQHPRILKKVLTSGLRKKPFTLPNGKIHYFQGYENVALELLLQEYDQSQIIMDILEIPIISYGRKRYFPDFFIPLKNLIIEVKSNFTYQCQLDQNIQKANATINASFNFEFWICDSTKVKNKIQWRES